jgi:DNA-binding beta-propeller fold protein YncE
VVGVAGCGSIEAVGDLPAAAGPDASPPLERPPAGRVVPLRAFPQRAAADSAGARAVVDDGRAVAVVRGRERVLELYDAAGRERIGSIPAGAGPTRVIGGTEGRMYVLDTAGDGLLVFERRPLRLARRLPLLGAPYGLAIDRERARVWVTLTATNEVVELSAGARPRFLRSFPAVRQPNAVAVDPVTGRVYVTGEADRVLQLLDPPRRTR